MDNQSISSQTFKVVEIEEDPLISKSVKAIFINNQPIWQGVDQVNTEFRVDKVLYQHFKEFLFNYFQLEDDSIHVEQEEDEKPTQNDSSKWCSSISNALTKKNEDLKLKGLEMQATNKVHVQASKYNANKK